MVRENKHIGKEKLLCSFGNAHPDKMGCSRIFYDERHLLLGRPQRSEPKWIARHEFHILIPTVVWDCLYVVQKPVIDYIKGKTFSGL